MLQSLKSDFKVSFCVTDDIKSRVMEIVCWGDEGSPFLMLPCWKAASPMYIVTDTYVVTTATHADMLVRSGHTNPI